MGVHAPPLLLTLLPPLLGGGGWEELRPPAAELKLSLGGAGVRREEGVETLALRGWVDRVLGMLVLGGWVGGVVEVGTLALRGWVGRVAGVGLEGVEVGVGAGGGRERGGRG